MLILGHSVESGRVGCERTEKCPFCGLEVMSGPIFIDGSVAIPGTGLPGIASILWDSEEVLGPYFIFNNTWPALTSYLVFQLSSRT